MRFRTSVLLVALLALGWSGVASAEDTTSNTVEPAAFAAMSHVSLDQAFELATTPATSAAWQAMLCQTTMQCETVAEANSDETCIVTASGDLRDSRPAALAHN